MPTLFIPGLQLFLHLTLLLWKAHGFSRKKWHAAKQIFISGGRVPIHNTTGQQQPSNATSNTHLWLTTFFDVIGDRLPDATIHLPISLTWREVHSMCANAHPSTVPVLTYSAMLKHIASHFGYVKLPKNSRLGKCSACIDFAQQQLESQKPS
ncbi:hypothetical protein DB44_GU00010 [Candidatus Protochlamydia amoebophila]|uniref:Uncharacterized protein n=1 Tax=Candidatus Protochlamydia amoebophila TaxID=362787 RepID=A0A0C1JGT3_9BACT|nr:hypothetical protein DB44_GU00010 [Candidatus Protochlamydia amoebophila]